MSWTTLAFVLFLALAPPADGQGLQPAPVWGSSIVLRHCSLEFEKTTLLGAAQTGIVFEILVKPGDRVKAGQVLGRLFDAELRAELDLRRAEAENDTDVRLGEAKLALAQSKLRASEALNKRNLMSAEDMMTHKLDTQTAGLEIEAARHRRRVAEFASRQVEAMILSREFVSPHDGIIVAVLKKKGESVAPNEPVLRLVNTETVRVTGFLDIGDVWQTRAGQGVRVTPEISGAELSIEDRVFAGRIDYVDPEINPEHQTCKVVAIVENKGGMLRAGLEARMEIAPDDGPLNTDVNRPQAPLLKR